MEKATRTSEIKTKDGKSLKRKFLGNLFSKKPIEVKELKAYIGGKEFFDYRGKTYFVRQAYFYA